LTLFTQRKLARLVPVMVISVLLFSTACGVLPGAVEVKQPDPATAERVGKASNALAFDLLTGLVDGSDEENVIISPLSISALLAMLLNGADGATAEAIAGVLHLDGISQEDTRELGNLLRYLGASDQDVELVVSNAVWPTTGYALQDEFVKIMEENFGAEVDELDLGSQQGADTIDGWVSDKTQGKIEKMSDALQLPDPNAVAVLMNAIYFKGNWTNPFNAEHTREGEFTLPDGSQVKVPMMTRDSSDFMVGEGDGFRVLRLPYGESERFGMEIFLPDEGSNAEELLAGLDAEAWRSVVADVSEARLLVTLPKFELEYKVGGELDDLLKELGMGIAYSPQSDFTRMAASDPWLSRVAHKTYLRVDEKGTEAAAVTGGVMVESMPPEFRVDRPFVFTISDSKSGAILFMGLVGDPSQ